MKYKTSIIHLQRAKERAPIIERLREWLPEAAIHFAFEPTWIGTQDTRSIIGSSVSHLQAYAYNSKDLPHLVLEDDAVVNREGLAELEALESLPEDCGILLVGGHTPNAYRLPSGLWEVFDPFHGAHAVLYNTEQLQKTHFLLHAYECLATHFMSDQAYCYEGILAAAVRRAGLRVYRLENMAFTTDDSVISYRHGRKVPARPTSVNAAPQEESIPYYE